MRVAGYTCARSDRRAASVILTMCSFSESLERQVHFRYEALEYLLYMLFVVRCDAGFKYVYAFFKLLSNILIVDCNLYRKMALGWSPSSGAFQEILGDLQLRR